MKHFRSLCIILAALILFSGAIACFAELPSRPASGFVVDNGALDPDVVSEFDSVASALNEKNGSAVYMLADSDFDGMTAEKFAREVFAEWKLPESAVLMVFSPELRDYYLLAGAKASERFPADKLKSLLSSSFEPPFAAGNYDSAALSLVNSLSAGLSELEPTAPAEESRAPTLWIIPAVIVVIAVVLILILRARKRSASKRRPGRGTPTGKPGSPGR